MSAVRLTFLPIVLLAVLAAALCVGVASASTVDQASTNGRATPAFEIYILPQAQTETVDDVSHAAFFQFIITNTGDQSGDITLDISGEPEGWTFQSFPGGTSLSFGPVSTTDDPRNVTLNVKVPTFEKAGTYDLEVRAVPAAPTNNKITIHAVVNQFPGVDLIPPPNIETDPGVELTLPFVIKNTGNGPDSYVLYRVDISSDWPYTIGNTNTTPTVKAQLQTQKQITITVPAPAEATPPGKSGVSVSVSVWSNFNHSIVDGATVLIKVTQQYKITFYPDEALEKTTGPEEQVDFSFTLANDGNGYDLVSLDLVATLDLWQLTISDDEINISSSPRPVTVSAIPGAQTTKGEYFLSVSATSSGPPESPQVVSYTMKIIVEQRYKFTVGIDTNASGPHPSIPPGGVGEHTLTLTNAGNGPDTIRLEVLNPPLGWFTTFDQDEVTVLPGKPKDIVLSIQVSNENEEALAKLYLLAVQATSTGNLSLVWEQNISVEVAPRRGISFSVSGPDTVLANPYQRSAYNHIFNLENTGNAQDDVRLEIIGVSWGPEIGITPTLATVNKEIGAFAKTSVQLSLTVPTNTPVGTYDIQVKATSLGDPRQSVTLMVHIQVIVEDIQVQPIRFKLASEPDTAFQEWRTYLVKQNGDVRLSFALINNGTETIYAINVKVLADNRVIHEENISSLRVLETYEIRVEFPATFLGPHQITVKADLPGDVNRDDNTQVAVIDVREELRDVNDANATNPFRAGSPLFFVLLLLAIIVVVAIIKVASGLGKRSSQKELYSTIYGQPGAGATQPSVLPPLLDEHQPPQEPPYGGAPPAY